MWLGSKSMGSDHKGLISLKEGNVVISDNIIISGEIVIDMSSITCTDITDSTYSNMLVRHLKSDDFFAVEKFPLASMKLISTKKTNNNPTNNYLVKADLTILDITHSIEFPLTITISNQGAEAEGILDIDRAKYGIKYKSKSWYDDLGDNFINDIFSLYFHLIAIK